MDREALAEQVTAEVLCRLQAAVGKDEGIAVGGAWPGWQIYVPSLCAVEQKRALIVHLAPWSLVRLAEGQAASAEEEFLLEMLLLGRPVFIAPKALDHHCYQDTAPKALYRQYADSEKKLLAMGVLPLTAAKDQRSSVKRRLLSAADVETFLAQGGSSFLAVSSGTIITPLAMDTLKAAQITVLREEREV